MKFATIFTIAAAATMASVSDAAPASAAPRAGSYPSFKASEIKSYALHSWGPQESLNTKADMIILDANLVDANTIKQQKSQGKKVVCYISAGTIENWRADAKEAKAEVSLGKQYRGFGGTEQWVNVLEWETAKPIMKQRISEAQAKGCDAIELDNIDCYVSGSACVAGASSADLKKKQIEYVRWLQSEVHGQGMAVGMKNSIEIIPDVIGNMDFAINEQCQQFSNGKEPECVAYKAFKDQNKVVVGIEYSPKSDVCETAKKYGILTKYQKSGKYSNCF